MWQAGLDSNQRKGMGSQVTPASTKPEHGISNPFFDPVTSCDMCRQKVKVKDTVKPDKYTKLCRQKTCLMACYELEHNGFYKGWVDKMFERITTQTKRNLQKAWDHILHERELEKKRKSQV